MNRPPLFVASRAGIQRLITSFRLQREEEWQTVYVDPETSDVWIRYPLWDYHGPGPDCLRRGNPSLEEVLDCIERSEDDSEISAAAYHLANELPGGSENFAALIERLELMTSSEVSDGRQMRNVALAIAWTKVDVAFNHRNPIGKTAGEIDADYAHFAKLAQRALTLKARARKILGSDISQKNTSFE